MELSRADRLRMTVKWLSKERGITNSEIGKMVGYDSNTYFSQLMNGHKPVSVEALERLANLDSRINLDFLLGTSDDMLGEGNEQPEIEAPSPQKVATRATGIFVSPELAQMVTDLAATVREQQTMIRSLVDKLITK